MSRALCAALLGLGCAAGVAVGLSDLPPWVATLVPVLLWASWPQRAAYGAAVFSASGGVTLVDPEAAAEAVKLQVRGRLAVLTLRIDGRLHRFVLALRADQRRHLVLWFDRHARPGPRQGWLAHV